MGDPSNGGAYVPRRNYTRTGATDSGGTYASATLTSPTLSGTTAIGSGATLTAPVLSGSVTGTYTLAGTPTIASPTINGPSISSIKSNVSTATVSAGYSADTYLAGSNIAIPTGGFVQGARYICRFDMVKTAAGTAQFTVVLRIGVAGATTDAAILTFAFAAGTAAADTGMFEVDAYFRSVGASTAAVVVGACVCNHALAATGLVSTGASGNGQLAVVSSGFDSTTASTIIGLSVNGGTSFSGTNTLVLAELRSY